MNHRRLRRNVSAYVDGEIQGAEEAEISRHVTECAECRGTAHLICLMKESLRRLGARRSAADASAQPSSRKG